MGLTLCWLAKCNLFPFDLRQFEINASLQFLKGILEGFKGIFSTFVGLITDWSCTLFRLKTQQETEYDSLFIGCFIFKRYYKRPLKNVRILSRLLTKFGCPSES